MRWFNAARARARLLSRREAEARMNDEMRFHLDMEAERLERAEGLDREEARRRALVAFGGVERHKEELRAGRTLAWLGGLSLDLRLGFRMLVKYPGLTVVGGLAMAFGVWVGVVVFEMARVVAAPTLPLPGGDRVVQIHTWDVKANDEEPRMLHDFLAWRGGLTSLTDLGAWRDVSHNLIASDGSAGPVVGAEITASAFRIAPDRPLLGRTLVASDEHAGAPPVVVLGYDLWRTRFASDSQVLGRSVRLGDGFATVVGVMPEGFEFPVSHELWTPLHAETLDRGPRAGPEVSVFGRLAPDATLEMAQAELAAYGRSAAAESRATHEHLQPLVVPYTRTIFGPSLTDRTLMLLINLFAVLLLVLVCSNVALLLFARAATREGEIIVRSALGASRGRIVTQLFAEALVLGGFATVLGLAAAGYALRAWGTGFLERNLGRLPFWIDPHLSPSAVTYAIGLTILGAGIAGVLPALKVTRGLGAQLRQRTAGAGVRFGGVWTAVIVAQVAVTVAFPAVAWFERHELVRMQSMDPGFAAEEYLGVRLHIDAPEGMANAGDSVAEAALRARFDAALAALRDRVAAEPGVQGVTFVSRMPHMPRGSSWVELDGAKPGEGSWVNTAVIDPSYFDVLEAPILSGRAFRPVDLTPGSHVVIVDRGFVAQVLKGRNPIGLRLRLGQRRTGDPAESEASRPWFEIVGVVDDLGMGHVAEQGPPMGLYLPAAPGGVGGGGAVYMMVHARGEPMALAPRLRTIAAAVDPALGLSEFQRLDQVSDALLWIMRLWLRVTLVLTAVALLLSLAGIYAVLSFTVAQRTREIGVRVALGASRRRVITDIFHRPLTQVGVGVVVGGLLVTAGAYLLSGHVPDGPSLGEGADGLSLARVAIVAAYTAFMFGVCLLACIVPTRRALRLEPTEALRVE